MPAGLAVGTRHFLQRDGFDPAGLTGTAKGFKT
jgi:hypothetical protein